METKNNTSAFKSLLVLLFVVSQSFWLQAQGSRISKKIVSGDQMNSLYIIGSVLVFGIVAYFVYSVIDKNRKAKGKEDGRSAARRSGSNRQHHHHRVIKKSA